MKKRDCVRQWALFADCQYASLQLINFLLWKSHFRKDKCPNINNVCYGNPQPEVNIAAWILRQSTALPTQLANINYGSYRPPTKLWENNVFTRVCLFTGDWGTHVTNTHNALEIIVQHPTPDIRHGIPQVPAPANDIWWPSLETYSNLFIWGPLASTDI